MPKLTMYQIDAFASEVFRGNPAAVVPLETWLDEALMQHIAAENNLSETAFFVPNDDGSYQLRWFTPTHEAPLCGHATLATAFVIFRHLKPGLQSIRFHTMSGQLGVRRHEAMLVLDFPSLPLRPCDPPEDLLKGLEMPPGQVFQTIEDTNYYGIFECEADIRAVKPNLGHLEKLHPFGVVVTAPGESCDFVSRYFAPGAGIPEDPVTGSIHCGLTPYWSQQLGKTHLLAQQLSRRGGVLHCELSGTRVLIGGQAAQFLEGTIYI